WRLRSAGRGTSRPCSKCVRRWFRCSRRGSGRAPRSSGRSTAEFLELPGVVGPHHDLPVDDDLTVPGKNDEGVGLERVEVRPELAGAERDGGLHGRRLQLAHGVEGELHGGPGVAGLVHDQHPPSGHEARRSGGDHRPPASLRAGGGGGGGVGGGGGGGGGAGAGGCGAGAGRAWGVKLHCTVARPQAIFGPWVSGAACSAARAPARSTPSASTI